MQHQPVKFPRHLLDGSAQRWFHWINPTTARGKEKRKKDGGGVVDAAGGEIHPDMWTDEFFSLNQGEKIDDGSHFRLLCFLWSSHFIGHAVLNHPHLYALRNCAQRKTGCVHICL